MPKGAEVHNTYGELGNVDLVSKYGFALSDNPFSVVLLNKASVLQAAERIMGVREMRLRCRFLRKERYEADWATHCANLHVFLPSSDLGVAQHRHVQRLLHVTLTAQPLPQLLTDLSHAPCSELLDEDAEPFEILPQGCIGPSLFVALFVICADGQLFSGWGHIEDAIQSMHEAQSAPEPSNPSGAHLYAETGCTDKRDSRKRGREASAGLVTGQQKVGRPGETAAQHSRLEQTGSEACDSSSRAQKQAKIGGIIDDSSHEGREDGSRDAGEWQPSIIMLRSAARSLINDSLAACLRTAITDHLQLYKHQSLAADLKQLQEAQQQCKRLRYHDEHWKAVLAALTLVVQEKRILQEALEALQER